MTPDPDERLLAMWKVRRSRNRDAELKVRIGGALLRNVETSRMSLPELQALVNLGLTPDSTDPREVSRVRSDRAFVERELKHRFGSKAGPADSS